MPNPGFAPRAWDRVMAHCANLGYWCTVRRPLYLVVGVKEAPPFAFRTPDGQWTGVSLDLQRFDNGFLFHLFHVSLVFFVIFQISPIGFFY